MTPSAPVPSSSTYRLVITESGALVYPGIQCLICGKISYNKNDIEQRYCGHCHRFHDRIPESPR